MDDPAVSRHLARGLVATRADSAARATVVEAYESAATTDDLPEEAVAVIAEGATVMEVAAVVGVTVAAMRPLPVKLVTWCGADSSMFPPNGDPALFVGRHFVRPGFTTTSTDHNAFEIPAGGWLMTVVTPAGLPALYLPESRELVLKPRTSFRVVSFNNGVVKVVAASTPQT